MARDSPRSAATSSGRESCRRCHAGHAFQQHAKLDALARFLPGKLRDDGALVLRPLHEPGRFEFHQGLPHGGLADGKILRQMCLAQRLAGRETAGKDGISNAFNHLSAKRGGFDGVQCHDSQLSGIHKSLSMGL